jgi:RNA polymerase sigma factor (sigma-70 family)
MEASAHLPSQTVLDSISNGKVRADHAGAHLTKPPTGSLTVVTMSLPPFQLLLDRHGHALRRLLLAAVGPDDAEDCYQETWLAALRAYPELREPANLEAWLAQIARHKAIDCLRRRTRSQAVGGAAELELLAGASAGIDADAPRSDADHGFAGLATIDARDDGPLAAVARLPHKQRAAVTLRVLLELSYAQVAATMATSEAAARHNVHAGLKRLREEYDDG